MAKEISILKKFDHTSFVASLRSDGIVYLK